MKTLTVKVAGALVLLASVVSLTACSYATDFVIVNDSTEVLKVEYRFKDFPGDFAPAAPSIVPGSQLSSHGNQKWTRLESGQYQIEPNQRAVSVSIMPGQALLVCRMPGYGGHSEAWNAKEFPVDQITLNGTSGVLLLKGEVARTTFSEISRALYVLEYK